MGDLWFGLRRVDEVEREVEEEKRGEETEGQVREAGEAGEQEGGQGGGQVSADDQGFQLTSDGVQLQGEGQPGGDRGRVGEVLWHDHKWMRGWKDLLNSYFWRKHILEIKLQFYS